jgi:hypothetical protein
MPHQDVSHLFVGHSCPFLYLQFGLWLWFGFNFAKPFGSLHPQSRPARGRVLGSRVGAKLLIRIQIVYHMQPTGRPNPRI